MIVYLKNMNCIQTERQGNLIVNDVIKGRFGFVIEYQPLNQAKQKGRVIGFWISNLFGDTYESHGYKSLCPSNDICTGCIQCALFDVELEDVLLN